jgi:peptide/nickel transport system permease protein
MWIIFRAVPGDPAAVYISGRLSPEDISALKKLWGLDEPLVTQFGKYFLNLVQGNFGISFYYREPVIDLLLPRLFNTLLLMGPAVVMSILWGAGIGYYLGWRRGSKRERIGVVLSLLARSFPIYLGGIVALMLFSHFVGLFPLGGMRTIGRIGSSQLGNLIDICHHVVLPLTVAILYYIGDVIVIARTSILEVIGEEFLEFARARGLSDKKVRRIARRNALLPVITYSTIMIGFAFGGQVLLEKVFAWPGIGRLMVDSVTRHDYPVAQASFFIMAVGVIVSNLLVDLLYGYLDPRIGHHKAG